MAATLSDARYKKQVHDSVPGLPFILKLRPVTYRLDVRGINRAGNVGESPEAEAGILAEEAEVQTGFIAQQVEQAAIATNYAFSGVSKPQNAQDYYALRYPAFVVPLVKAVQEQQALINALQMDIARKSAQLTQLELRLRALEAKSGGSAALAR